MNFGFYPVRKPAALGSLLVSCALAGAAFVGPYSPDADTLHLWHLDEPAAPAVNAIPGATNLVVLANGATLGNASFPGFGRALSTLDGGQGGGNTTSAVDAYLAPRTLVNGSGDNVEWGFADPYTGAFTFEALLWIGFDPLANLGTGGTGRNLPLQIITGEQDGTGGGVRSWQFRLDPVGFNPNADGYTAALTRPALEFINVNNGTAIEHFISLIPTNGPDAIVSNAWYHVAVTYTGREGTPDNLRFYWTRVETNRTAATPLASRQMNKDLLAGPVDFCLGNTGRATPNQNFLGLLDEVRISRVARAATEFLFQPGPPTDDDADGLPDWWETYYFGNPTLYTGTDDPDGDGFDNLAEYLGGSNPTNSLSTPLDTDADGLPDAWERAFFGSLGLGPGDDPDQDGFTNLAEFLAGTHPNYSGSTPLDTDADGLPDSWEREYFGDLSAMPGQDPDGDGFGNLQEYRAGTHPNDPDCVPPGPRVKFIPLDDANPWTSEFGYAGSSSINAVCFTREALMTVGEQQFIAWYYRHQSNPADPDNDRIFIGRRCLRTNVWEIFRTPFTANNITDGHDTASFGIDGDGYLHLSWGMHGDRFHYARSTNPVTGLLPIGFGPDTTMTGDENAVTYPQFFTLPDGDLIYLFREGGSGNGDLFLNRWNLATRTWTNVHYNAGQRPFIKGTDWTPNYNPYPNMPQLDADGNFHLIWTWRYGADSPAGEVGYQTNHDFAYGRSTNGGLTWLRQDGTPYTLPINECGENGETNSIAEKILAIPEGWSLINQAGMCLDASNRPVLASWWAPGTATNNFRRQYMVAFPEENNLWQIRQVSWRTNDPPGTKYSETYVRDLGRPVVVCDREDRIIVLYRDNFGSNGLSVVHSLPRSRDPQRTNWTTFDLTTDNLGFYEPLIDWERWKRDNVLHILYQPAAGLGFSPPANNAAQIGVLEWDAAAWFAHRPRLRLSVTNHADVRLSFYAQPGWAYRVQTSTNLLQWDTLATLTGVMGTQLYVHTNALAGPARFWRVECREGGF